MSALKHDASSDMQLPCGNCILAEEVRDIKETVNKIHTVIVGEPELGNKGVIPRLREVESTIEAHDRKLLVWGSVLASAGVVTAFAKDFIVAFFHN